MGHKVSLDMAKSHRVERPGRKQSLLTQWKRQRNRHGRRWTQLNKSSQDRAELSLTDSWSRDKRPADGQLLTHSSPPRWLCGKVSASRAGDRDLLPGRHTTTKLALLYLTCQTPGAIRSVLGLVSPVSVYCDWARWFDLQLQS